VRRSADRWCLAHCTAREHVYFRTCLAGRRRSTHTSLWALPCAAAVADDSYTHEVVTLWYRAPDVLMGRCARVPHPFLELTLVLEVFDCAAPTLLYVHAWHMAQHGCSRFSTRRERARGKFCGVERLPLLGADRILPSRVLRGCCIAHLRMCVCASLCAQPPLLDAGGHLEHWVHLC
jgi:hypothetical protein